MIPQMIHFETIIQEYYPEDNKLRQLLWRHSRDVADRALDIVRRHPELGADAHFVEQAAMLHDLGIFLTDAPGIHCHGKEPYIRHGLLGAGLLRRDASKWIAGNPQQVAEAIEPYARVCERHTGAGISLSNIERQQLPLPHHDFLPETIEEQIICYADKFFSKSHPERVKTLEQPTKSLSKFGEDGVGRFLAWAGMFE